MPDGSRAFGCQRLQVFGDITAVPSDQDLAPGCKEEIDAVPFIGNYARPGPRRFEDSRLMFRTARGVQLKGLCSVV